MSSAMVVNGKLARYPDPPQIYHTRPARTKPRIGRLKSQCFAELCFGGALASVSSPEVNP